MQHKESDNCVFDKIIRGILPCKKVHENDFGLAFWDIAPVAPVHVLAVPKLHYQNFHEFVSRAKSEEVSGFFAFINQVIDRLDLDGQYRIISNSGEMSGQTVFHFHVHIIGGKKLEQLI